MFKKILIANRGKLESDATVINRDPYGEGWLIKVKVKDKKELEGLLPAEKYKAMVG